MVQSFDEWKKSQNTATPATSSPVKAGKIQSFDEWKKTQPITPEPEKGLLSKALDVGKSAVQSVVQGFTKGVARTALTAKSAYLEGQSVAGTLMGNEQKAKDYHEAYKQNQTQETDLGYFGKEKPIQNPLDAVGVGLDVGSNLVTGGGASSLLKAGAKGFVKQAAKTGVKTGLASGALMGAGQGMQQENPTVMDALKSTAIGAGTGAIAGGILGVASGAFASKFKPKVVAEPKVSAAMDVVKTEPKPPVNWNQDMPIPQAPRPSGLYTPDNELPVIDMGGKPTTPSPITTPPNVNIPKYPIYPRPAYDPYTPHNELPTIDMGSSPKVPSEKLPTISYDGNIPSSKPDGITYEPIKKSPIISVKQPIIRNKIDELTYEPISQIPSVKNNQPEYSPPRKKPTPVLQRRPQIVPIQEQTTPILSQPNPVETTSRLTPVEGTGAVKTRGLAKSLEEKLQKSLGPLPEYNVVGNEGQFKNVAEITATDIERAKRIALGQEAPPQGTHPEAFYVAVSKMAEKDPALALKLGRESALVGDATTMGQRIQLLSQLNPDSPVNVIKDVQKSYDLAATKKVPGGNISKAKQQAVNEIKTEIAKAKPKVEDWSGFIDSLTC